MSSQYRKLQEECKNLQKDWHEERCSGRGIDKDTLETTVRHARQRRNNWEAQSSAGLMKDDSSTAASAPRRAARTPPPSRPARHVRPRILHPAPESVPCSGPAVSGQLVGRLGRLVKRRIHRLAQSRRDGKRRIKTDEITTDATPSHREEAAVDGPFPTLLRFSSEAIVSALIAEQNVLKSAFGTETVNSKERKRELKLLDSVYNLPQGTLEMQLKRQR